MLPIPIQPVYFKASDWALATMVAHLARHSQLALPVWPGKLTSVQRVFVTGRVASYRPCAPGGAVWKPCHEPRPESAPLRGNTKSDSQ